MDSTFRAAVRADLATIVGLLADDTLGEAREAVAEELPASYVAAFDAIAGDANHELIVAESGGRVTGVLQLSFLPNLTYRGGWRAQIEGVRVAAEQRGRGLGAALLRHAIDRARQRGCVLVQLTSDKRRADAIRFYEGLGFAATHEGMKLWL